jgi:ribosome-binding ATPase YchF (GTP1/OBG family)
VKKQDGLTPDILLKHMLKNLEDENVIDALVNVGQGALTYEFFSQLSDEIEKREKANDASAAQLKALRDKLLQVQESLREASQKVLAQAQELLNKILQSADREAMIKTNMNQIDDAFMYVLSANVAQADQQGDTERVQALSEIQSLIVKTLESQYPPEILFLNQLLETDSPMEQQQLLDENPELVSPQLIQMLEAVEKQLQDAGQANGDTGRIASVKQMIRARLDR